MITRDDLYKIEQWLYKRTIKDTELPKTSVLDGTEWVPIVQKEENKVISLNDFVREVAYRRMPDYFNVTADTNKKFLTLKEAIEAVPVGQRKLGLTITFHGKHGNWLIYQFKGDSVDQFTSSNYWSSLIMEAIEELVFFPDEEDITGVRDGNRTFLKFKNKDYNPEDFSGLGRIYLRKNLEGTRACAIDDEDHMLNILTQSMISEPNTIYIIQYDYDLEGKTIGIPENCILWFQGGSFNNGTVNVNGAAILGAFEFADMGDVKLFGNFNTGQIFTFHNDDWKKKEGNYFKATTKASSATASEDAKQDKETFYDVNSSAYVSTERQELRWWNGEEWILILDIEDYNEIKSVIADLIEKHNAEMSACYKYFKKRCYAIELRVDELERWRREKVDPTLEDHEKRITKNTQDIVEIRNDITNIESNITNLGDSITNMGDNITNLGDDISGLGDTIKSVQDSISSINDALKSIEGIMDTIEELRKLLEDINQLINDAIENNGSLVKSIEVNGETYTPSNGKVTLPDYPEASGGSGSIEGKLTFTGAVDAVFDGSSDVTVNIPVPQGGEMKTLTIKQGDSVLGTYDGSEDKEITIPKEEVDVEDRLKKVEDDIEEIKSKYASILFLSSEYTINLDKKQLSTSIPLTGYNLENQPAGNLNDLVNIAISGGNNITASVDSSLLKINCNDTDSEVNSTVKVTVKGLEPSHLVYNIHRDGVSVEPEPEEPTPAEIMKETQFEVLIYRLDDEEVRPSFKVYVRATAPKASSLPENFYCELEGEVAKSYTKDDSLVMNPNFEDNFEFGGSPRLTKSDIVNNKPVLACPDKYPIYAMSGDHLKAGSQWNISLSRGSVSLGGLQFNGETRTIDYGSPEAGSLGLS